MDSYSFKRLQRRPWLALLGLLISAALCTLLCSLSGYLAAEEARLQEIRRDYKILCVVSDVRGTKTKNLLLTEIHTEKLLDPEGMGAYIEDPRLLKRFLWCTYEEGGANIPLYDLIGVSSPGCSAALDETQGGGYTSEVDDFFNSHEKICLVSKGQYEEWKGQSITMKVVDPRPVSSGLGGPRKSDGVREFQVVGWYEGEGQTVFIPYPASQTLSRQLSGAASTDSASFYVKDNDQLDELLEAADPWFTQVQFGAVAPKGLLGLIVQDEQYRSTLAAVEQNIQRLRYLLPVLTLLSLGAGFLIGFLATRGEARTYALMRTIGMTRRKLFFSVLFEQMIAPALAAVGVGIITGKPLAALVFLVCHTVGCALVVVRAVRVPPTQLLREQE